MATCLAFEEAKGTPLQANPEMATDKGTQQQTIISWFSTFTLTESHPATFLVVVVLYYTAHEWHLQSLSWLKMVPPGSSDLVFTGKLEWDEWLSRGKRITLSLLTTERKVRRHFIPLGRWILMGGQKQVATDLSGRKFTSTSLVSLHEKMKRVFSDSGRASEYAKSTWNYDQTTSCGLKSVSVDVLRFPSPHRYKTPHPSLSTPPLHSSAGPFPSRQHRGHRVPA